MTITRYEDRLTLTNREKLYNELFDERGVSFIRHYSTPDLRYPTPGEFSELQILYNTWKVGDRYWKIAESNYGRPELWWIIAWFNKKPTEAHLTIGQQILIPQPLERIISMLGI